MRDGTRHADSTSPALSFNDLSGVLQSVIKLDASHLLAETSIIVPSGKTQYRIYEEMKAELRLDKLMMLY